MNGNFFIILLVYVALGFGVLSYAESMNKNKADKKAEKELEVENEIFGHKFMIPHDGDPNTNTIKISLNAADFMDTDQDNLMYTWSSKDAISLEYPKGARPENNTSTSFTAGAGTYLVKLTVTDSYGASNTAEKLVTIVAEENSAPEIGIINSTLAP